MGFGVLMKRILLFFCLFLIKMYRVFLSIHFGGACRFHPSCSCYAEQAFLSYSFAKAFYLVLRRLSRCHFFGSFGWDPVPERDQSGKRGKRNEKTKET